MHMAITKCHKKEIYIEIKGSDLYLIAHIVSPKDTSSNDKLQSHAYACSHNASWIDNVQSDGDSWKQIMH